MCRPARRFYFTLALKLGMTVKNLLNDIDSHELSEWIAYFMTRDEDWVKNYDKQKEIEAQSESSLEDKVKAARTLFGIKK